MKELFEILGRILAIVSILVLFFGSSFIFLKRQNESKFNFIGIYFILLFTIELTSLVWGHYYGKSGLVFFSLSFFIHFVFLSYLYLYQWIKIATKWLILILVLGTVPLLLGQLIDIIPAQFQSYDRAIYSFLLLLYSMVSLFRSISGHPMSKSQMILNSGVFFFFALDTFLAITTNYLINESLTLVGWFWIGRALALHFFYASLIYYIWKNGKTLSPH